MLLFLLYRVRTLQAKYFVIVSIISCSHFQSLLFLLYHVHTFSRLSISLLFLLYRVSVLPERDKHAPGSPHKSSRSRHHPTLGEGVLYPKIDYALMIDKPVTDQIDLQPADQAIVLTLMPQNRPVFGSVLMDENQINQCFIFMSVHSKVILNKWTKMRWGKERKKKKRLRDGPIILAQYSRHED